MHIITEQCLKAKFSSINDADAEDVPADADRVVTNDVGNTKDNGGQVFV